MYGLCGQCFLKRAWHGMVQGYTVLKTNMPDEPARILSMVMHVSMFDLFWIGWVPDCRLCGRRP